MNCSYCDKKINNKLSFNNIFSTNYNKILCEDCKSILSINRTNFKKYTFFYLAKYVNIKEVIYSIKYQGDVKNFLKFKYILATFLKNNKYDIITFVPSNETRSAIRTFNSIELLCQICNIPYKALFFSPYREKQAKSHKKRKLQNIELLNNIKKENLIGKKILIIDDIFTSGMTLLSCAKCLEQNSSNITIDFLTLSYSK